MLECVVNVSEGRDDATLALLCSSVGDDLLDLHRDPHHHRAVFTLIGESAPRALGTAAVAAIDIRRHAGVHPRIGVVDVVPFVPLEGSSLADAVTARDEFAHWAAATLEVPVFLYGPERTLPDIRRAAWDGLRPDHGPDRPHPSAGAMAVGARAPLVAYNLWLDGADLATARRIAVKMRGPAVRALGLEVGDAVQVSMNLVDPLLVGPAEVWDAVAALAPIERAELVGLISRAALDRIDPSRWEQLDLSEQRTIEWRLAHRTDPGAPTPTTPR
ncbi:MAG: glutamate formiminotransferase [Acidimicrobiia bacterium]|nr:glutamate formiminotransferase [Acidimicrobiia bacterium]